MTPVWLLDIDGVINTYGGGSSPPTHAWPKADWIVTKVNGFHIWASNSVVTFIRDVASGDLAEIRWHTTWQHDAELLADVLHLPTFPVQDAPEYELYTQDAKGWWKLPAAQRVVMEEKRELLWTDDDAGWSLSPGHLQHLHSSGRRVEIISPSEQTGLCKRHLRQIRQFLTGRQDGFSGA